ncbi:MAG: FHA domain-containing protein [Chloroflexi bacterium]|nr:FHA domain-containing protein [Chloroflexota bacterium]
MIICSFCGTHNREGELYCQECGNPLRDSPRVATRQLNSEKVNPVEKKVPWGTSRFQAKTAVAMTFAKTNDTINIENKEQLIIGRKDEQSGNYPDIDLTPYGALDDGVSRVHACFLRSKDAITILDIDSVIGTYLNGQRLIPHQPRVLQDGDELRFGKMVSHVYFK